MKRVRDVPSPAAVWRITGLTNTTAATGTYISMPAQASHQHLSMNPVSRMMRVRRPLPSDGRQLGRIAEPVA